MTSLLCTRLLAVVFCLTLKYHIVTFLVIKAAGEVVKCTFEA